MISLVIFLPQEKLERKGGEVYNSILNSVNSLRMKFCKGEFCVTPTGDLVSCHRVSSIKENSFYAFNFGNIDKEVHIDTAKIDRVLDIAKVKKEDCYTCFAKWHCAGYGDKESKVVQNTVGNIFSGQEVGKSAKTLSERFGKVLQKRQSMTINRQDKSTSISTQFGQSDSGKQNQQSHAGHVRRFSERQL